MKYSALDTATMDVIKILSVAFMRAGAIGRAITRNAWRHLEARK